MFEVLPEIARVAEFPEGITSGLVSVSVFVSVIARFPPVALRTDQKSPPRVVAVDDGRVIALKALLVT